MDRFADLNGCYYNNDACPVGWIVLENNYKTYERYDMEYNFVESGENRYYTNDYKKFNPFSDKEMKTENKEKKYNKNNR